MKWNCSSAQIQLEGTLNQSQRRYRESRQGATLASSKWFVPIMFATVLGGFAISTIILALVMAEL
jgi:hypothetical protein